MMQPSVIAALCRAAASGDARQIAAVRSLKAEIDARGDRIDELERLLGLNLPASALGISGLGASIIGLLVARPGVVTVSMLETALYGARPESDWPLQPAKTIHVHVNHLRDRLQKHSIVISTTTADDGSRGYFLTPKMRAKVRALFTKSAKPQCSDTHAARGIADDRAVMGARSSQ
jgi:hypothetical protein